MPDDQLCPMTLCDVALIVDGTQHGLDSFRYLLPYYGRVLRRRIMAVIAYRVNNLLDYSTLIVIKII